MPSIYVHVPFCRQKCAYCAFYSEPLENKKKTSCLTGAASSIRKYLTGLALEVGRRSSEEASDISSVFWGGGTPSILQRDELEEVFCLIEQGFIRNSGGPGREVTVECNPGTIDAGKIRVMLKHGVNRISLGVQSLNDRTLRNIGRVHNTDQVVQSLDLIRNEGIGNINFDLIFGLPGQTLKDWQDTLQKAVSLAPRHFSLYALTLEPETPLGERYLNLTSLGKESSFLPDDDLQADMYEWAVSYLARYGYNRYEISNFSLPGYECEHNLSYWRGEEYIGLGPGAVSCLQGIRHKNVEDIIKYEESLARGILPVEEGSVEKLTWEEKISEYMMLGLRTAEGVGYKEFEEKFKCEMQDIYGQILENYINEKILIPDQGRLKINPCYFFVANTILQRFII